jgi:hypothetical protein
MLQFLKNLRLGCSLHREVILDAHFRGKVCPFPTFAKVLDVEGVEVALSELKTE